MFISLQLIAKLCVNPKVELAVRIRTPQTLSFTYPEHFTIPPRRPRTQSLPRFKSSHTCLASMRTLCRKHLPFTRCQDMSYSGNYEHGGHATL
ncbi:hypothetical protein BDR06DRAFT_96293 [Suillus hirtellus]|nr:hypothetical protein BDR06DRAFT_96293 [Suillus hirtellus]